MSKQARTGVRRLVREFHKAASPAQPSEAANLCQRLIAQAFETDIIRDFLSAQTFGSAGAAVRHENGFYRVPLYADDALGVRLRLHVWRPDAPPIAAESTPHSHRWDIYSVVICGALLTSTFTETAKRSDAAYRRYGRTKGRSAGAYRLTDQGLSRLNHVCSDLRTPGSGYFLRRGAIHSAIANSSELTATLAVTVARTRTRTSDYAYYPKHEPNVAGGRAHSVISTAEANALVASALKQWTRP